MKIQLVIWCPCQFISVHFPKMVLNLPHCKSMQKYASYKEVTNIPCEKSRSSNIIWALRMKASVTFGAPNLFYVVPPMSMDRQFYHHLASDTTAIPAVVLKAHLDTTQGILCQNWEFAEKWLGRPFFVSKTGFTAYISSRRASTESRPISLHNHEHNSQKTKLLSMSLTKSQLAQIQLQTSQCEMAEHFERTDQSTFCRGTTVSFLVGSLKHKIWILYTGLLSYRGRS